MWIAVHLIHIAAFLGCLTASGLKLRVLTAVSLDGLTLAKLRRLDKISASSTGVIILTGAAMLAAQPGRSAHLLQFAFQFKLVLFVVASSLILATKVFLRRSPGDLEDGSVPTPGWMRRALLADFLSILIIAGIGIAFAHGLI